MAEHSSPWVFDVSEQDFMAKAVEPSKTAVVIVDFWAEWCGPCKMLRPLLEQIVDSYGGKVLLAKVNVDENKAISAQLGIQSIPTVKILKNGEIANEFVGVQTEPQIRDLLDELVGPAEADPVAVANELLAEGNLKDAAEIFATLMENDPKHVAARLGLAKVVIAEGDGEKARSLLESFDVGEEGCDEAKALLDGLSFVAVCHAAGTPEEIKAKAAADPEDLEALYALGCCHASTGNHAEALEVFLSIVKKDRSFGEGKAQEAMKSIFEIAGQQSDLTREFRSRLASLLF